MRSARLISVVLAAGVSVVAAGCSSGSSAPKATGTTPAASPSSSPGNSSKLDLQLSRMLLTSSQVAAIGTPVITRLYKGGNQVANQVTLDACNGHFASESKRVARIQVGYLAITGPLAGRQVASNEVVRYAPGGTIAAFSELQQVARNCPARVRFSKTEIQTNFVIQPSVPGLGSRQLTVTSLLHVQQQQLWSAAAYLYNGNLFDGVYVFGRTQAQALKAVRQLGRAAYQRMTSAAVAGGLTV